MAVTTEIAEYLSHLDLCSMGEFSVQPFSGERR
jgi:hypothetical protein